MEESSTQSVKAKIAGLVFLLCVLGAVMYGSYLIDRYLEDEQQAPIQNVMFSGEYARIDAQVTEREVHRNHPGSFFDLDVAKLHSELEEKPWVYRASVRKRWPNGLHIHLIQQDVVAKWNEDQLLNRFGDSFMAQIEEPLPALFGPGGSEQTVLQGYRAIQALLDSVSLVASEVFLSERYAWQVNLENGIKLNLGRTEFIDRVQRFVDLYPLLSEQEKAVDYVDLRYDTGLAVGWIEPSKTES